MDSAHGGSPRKGNRLQPFEWARYRWAGPYGGVYRDKRDSKSNTDAKSFAGSIIHSGHNAITNAVEHAAADSTADSATGHTDSVAGRNTDANTDRYADPLGKPDADSERFGATAPGARLHQLAPTDAYLRKSALPESPE